MPPHRADGAIILELADQAPDRIVPDLLVTYGGHQASLQLKRRGRVPMSTA